MVKVTSCLPPVPEMRRDNNVALFVLWSWGFTIKQTWQGLMK